MLEKLPAPAKGTFIKAHHLSVVIFPLPVEKAKVHETVSNGDGRNIEAFFTDHYCCVFGLEERPELVGGLIFQPLEHGFCQYEFNFGFALCKF